jgi:ABC-type Fe3+ transport system permease subunit
MKTAALIAALGAILIGAAVAIVMAWRSTDVDISIFGWVVIGIGALLAIALGGGLMALSFFSARRGFDDRLNEQDPER